MAQCTYHPDKRGTASCPQCKEPICDRCRLNGTSQRCMTCQSAASRGAPEAQAKRVQCLNHPGVPTDQKCVGCKKPHCAACLNGQSRCFRCAMTGPGPSGGAGGARGKTQPLKGGAKTGKLKGPPPKKGPPPWVIPAAVGAVAVIGLAAFMLRPKPAPAPVGYHGPVGVAIVSPTANRPVSRAVVIKLKVTGAAGLERVELTVDGKYWDKFTAPPYSSDWPTAILPNGQHTIEAKAYYKGGRTAKSRVSVTTRN